MFMNICQTFTSRMDQIYPLYQKMALHYGSPESRIYGDYLTNVAQFGFEEHAYMDTAAIAQDINFNGNVMYLNDVKEYNDSVYAIMLLDNSFKLKYFAERIGVLRNNQNNQSPERKLKPRKVGFNPRSVTEAEWWGNDTIGKDEQAYQYQSKTELGYYDLRFDDIVGPESAPGWNAAYRKYVGNLRDYESPYFKDFPFDNSLYIKTVTTTRNATKPIIFIYGEDDPWTGAAIKDEYINGTNVKKFILPAQNHNASFSSNTDIAKCNAIRDMLDEVFGAASQGIDEVHSGNNQNGNAQSTKVIRNGQLLIIRDGEIYNTIGIKVQ